MVTGRRFAAIGAGAVAVAIVAVLSAALLWPVDSCACATPLDLVVQNYSPRDATVSWNQPGLFGTPIRGFSGGAVATSCRTLSAGLRSGEVDVTVSTGPEVLVVRLDVRRGVMASPATILIDSSGHISAATYQAPPGGLRQQDALC